MKKNKTKVLFFANIPVIKEERSIGGATVLAENILRFLQNEDSINVEHQQIRRFWRNKLQLIDYLIWIFRFPFKIRKFDVISFHGTKDFHFTIAPILWIWAKLFNKKICYHFFGGNFFEQYENLPKIIQTLLRNTILSSNTVFLETKQLVNYFKEFNNNIVWLPNARKPQEKVRKDKKFNKRFIFISRIVPQKGINEIIKASEILSTEYTIDLYGPIDNRWYTQDFLDGSRVSYKGVLKPEEISEILIQYDVLLLPTYFEGEGYPGIIIEALSLKIPVITTVWRAIPEVIQNKYNGLLVPIKDSTALAAAMKYFNEENYSTFQKQVEISFQNFNSEIVFKKFIISYLKK